MSKLNANTLLKFGITAGIELLVAAVYFFLNIPLSQIYGAETVDVVLVLCDSFFVPGAFTLLIGLLLWVASEGALDGIGYLGSCLVKALLPGKHGSLESYGDYLERKRENRKKGCMGFLCVAGLAFLLIACVFWALFYALY